MPIRRQHLWLYPIDWRELSLSIRFRRTVIEQNRMLRLCFGLPKVNEA